MLFTQKLIDGDFIKLFYTFNRIFRTKSPESLRGNRPRSNPIRIDMGNDMDL